FWIRAGHLAEARRWLEAFLARGSAAPPALRASALLGAGLMARISGDHARASELIDEAVALRQGLGDNAATAAALYCRATIAAEQLRESTGAPLGPAWRPRYDEAVRAIRSAADDRLFENAWAVGRASALPDTIAYALDEPKLPDEHRPPDGERASALAGQHRP